MNLIFSIAVEAALFTILIACFLWRRLRVKTGCDGMLGGIRSTSVDSYKFGLGDLFDFAGSVSVCH